MFSLLLQTSVLSHETTLPKNSSHLLLQQCDRKSIPLTTTSIDSVVAMRQTEEPELTNDVDHNDSDNIRDFIENEILNELKSSCEELDTIGASESLPLSAELDDLIKPVLQFNLGDSANELKLNSSTVLCNSSISEEDSGFLSSEAIIATTRESDSGLENMRFADDDSIIEEKPPEPKPPVDVKIVSPRSIKILSVWH